MSLRLEVRLISPLCVLLCLQIHVIDFDDENNIINKSVLLHQAGEIWHIGASPADKAVLTTCYNKSESDCFLLSLTPVTASSHILFLCLTLFLFSPLSSCLAFPSSDSFIFLNIPPILAAPAAYFRVITRHWQLAGDEYRVV